MPVLVALTSLATTFANWAFSHARIPEEKEKPTPTVETKAGGES